MSRSYKKNPFVTDNGNAKYGKRVANRTVRRRIKNDEEMPARLQHKKMTESLNICDYRWRMTRREAIEWYETRSTYDPQGWYAKRWPTLEAWLKYWDKCHRRK